MKNRIFAFIKLSIIENSTYKLVALFITLSLWVFIFERQVSTITKNLKLDFVLPTNHVIANRIVKEVQFKVRGPRMALKRFSESSNSISVDLSTSGVGRTMVRIYDDILELPPSLQVVSVQPTNVFVEIEKRVQETNQKTVDQSVPVEEFPKEYESGKN